MNIYEEKERLQAFEQHLNSVEESLLDDPSQDIRVSIQVGDKKLELDYHADAQGLIQGLTSELIEQANELIKTREEKQ